jgi:uncharacterized protein
MITNHPLNTFRVSLLSILALLICSNPVHASKSVVFGPEQVDGYWHSLLQIPSGELTLIFKIDQDDDGNYTAQMESPDQAPGRMMDLSQVSIDGDKLTLALAPIGMSIETNWDDENQQWVGTFSQGLKLPITIVRGLPENKPIIEGLDGDWRATINRNGVDLRLILHITTTKAGTNASLDSPDMLASGIKISELTKAGNTIAFKVPSTGGTFVGKLDSNDSFTGAWSVPNQDLLDVTFTRDLDAQENNKPNRPQVPTEPFEYTVEQVTYDNPLAEGVTMAGTLTIPAGKGPFPAAILISGSGPQDRNETVFGHQPFLVLAHHLTSNGIAVLRYDDRGVGESTGDFSSATSADFATDANAGYTFLSTREEIDQESIGFVGHSEGGLIAPIAMETNPSIAYLVMLAGPGTSAKQIVQSQNRLIALSQGTKEEDIAKTALVNAQIVDAIAASSSDEEAGERIRELMTPENMEIMGVNESQLEMIISQSTTPWRRFFLNYDPAHYLPSITCPVLAINGELDLQVPAEENIKGIKSLLLSNKDVTAMTLEGLNHLFQTAKTGALGEYNDIEETFAPQAMEIISSWINKRFGSND